MRASRGKEGETRGLVVGCYGLRTTDSGLVKDFCYEWCDWCFEGSAFFG